MKKVIEKGEYQLEGILGVAFDQTNEIVKVLVFLSLLSLLEILILVFILFIICSKPAALALSHLTLLPDILLKVARYDLIDHLLKLGLTFQFNGFPLYQDSLPELVEDGGMEFEGGRWYLIGIEGKLEQSAYV